MDSGCVDLRVPTDEGFLSPKQCVHSLRWTHTDDPDLQIERIVINSNNDYKASSDGLHKATRELEEP